MWCPSELKQQWITLTMGGQLRTPKLSLEGAGQLRTPKLSLADARGGGPLVTLSLLLRFFLYCGFPNSNLDLYYSYSYSLILLLLLFTYTVPTPTHLYCSYCSCSLAGGKVVTSQDTQGQMWSSVPNSSSGSFPPTKEQNGCIFSTKLSNFTLFERKTCAGILFLFALTLVFLLFVWLCFLFANRS